MSATEETARNKAVIRRLPKLLDNPDLAIIRETFTEDFCLHDVKFPDWPPGYEGAARMFVQMKAMIPDLEVHVEDMFGEDDRVFVRWRFKGTVTGSYQGRKGDGSRLETIVFSVYRFENGRIAEDWGADIVLPKGHVWRTG